MKVVIPDYLSLVSIITYHISGVIFIYIEDQKMPLVNEFMSFKGFVVVTC